MIRIEPIRKASTYTAITSNGIRVQAEAEHDGILLVDYGKIVPVEQMANAITQLGYKCKRRG